MGLSGRGPVGFDLDMTLINSRPAILASFAAVGRETGTAIDLDAVDRRLGIKLDDELGYWFAPDRIDAAAVVYRRHYLELAGPMTTVLPGAREALAAVRAAGQQVVVITAKHHVSAEPRSESALTSDFNSSLSTVEVMPVTVTPVPTPLVTLLDWVADFLV